MANDILRGDRGGAMGFLEAFVLPLVFFIPLGTFVSAHYHDEDTSSIDIVGPIFCFISIAIMTVIIFFTFCIDGNPAERVRYTLSKLRIPGFWGSTLHGRSCVGEGKRNCCAMTVFFTFFFGIIVVFFSLMGFLIYDKNAGYTREEIQLLNGMIPFTPSIKPSENGTFVDVFLPRSYELAYGMVTNDTSLVDGGTIERHGKKIILHHNPDELAFYYTFAPGSSFHLNINSTSKMKVYYRKNETVIKNNDTVSEFQLSVTETAFTSYVIYFTSASVDVNVVSFDFTAHIMVFDMSNAISISVNRSFYVERGESLILYRNSSYSMIDEYEYVEVYLMNQESFLDSMPSYQWTWLHTALVCCSLWIYVEHLITFMIVCFNEEGNYRETPSQLTSNSMAAFGHANMMFLFATGIAFFALGYQESLEDIDAILVNKSILSFSDYLYSGEQVIIPLKQVNYTCLLNFTSTEDDVNITALKVFPDNFVNETIDYNPRTFEVRDEYLKYFYFVEGYSFHWDFESTEMVDVFLSNGTDTIFRETYVENSKQSIVCNQTGYYKFIVSIRSYDTAALIFKSLILETRKFDLSKCEVWSDLNSVNMIELEPSVKYVVFEPEDPRYGTGHFYFLQVKQDDYLSSTIAVSQWSFVLIFVFVGLVLFAFAMLIMDIAAGIFFPCCFIGIDLTVDDNNDRNTSMDSRLLDKEEQVTSETGTAGGSEVTPTPGDEGLQYGEEEEDDDDDDDVLKIIGEDSSKPPSYESV